LRNVYIENSHLVVEQYDPESGNMAKTFTRSHYQWSGGDFHLVKAERVPNDLKYGEPRVLLNRSRG
jgi:hypothetical protein